MFLLKKLVSAFLNPLPLCLLILLVGLVLLWRSKKPGSGRGFLVVGFVLLLVMSFEFIPHAAVRALENDYVTYSPEHHPEADVQWVVVLASGVRDESTWPPNNQLTATSLARLVEGIRVLHYYPEARLLLSGRGYQNTIPEAIAMQQAAAFLGVDSARVQVEIGSNDTADQAVNVKALIGEDAAVLVTSAMHMRRAEALFNKQGLYPLPAPAQHLVRLRGRIGYNTFFPSSGNISTLQAAWHEYLGYAWGRLTGLL